MTSIDFAHTPDGKVLTIDPNTGQLTTPLSESDALFWLDALTRIYCGFGARQTIRRQVSVPIAGLPKLLQDFGC